MAIDKVVGFLFALCRVCKWPSLKQAGTTAFGWSSKRTTQKFTTDVLPENWFKFSEANQAWKQLQLEWVFLTWDRLGNTPVHCQTYRPHNAAWCVLSIPETYGSCFFFFGRGFSSTAIPQIMSALNVLTRWLQQICSWFAYSGTPPPRRNLCESC